MARNRLLMATVAGLALAFGASGVAHAVPAYGYAELGFTNFALTGVNLATSTTSVQAINGANYPGYSSNPAGGSQTVNGNVNTGVDIPQITAGPGAFPGENTFTQALLPASSLTPAGTRADGVITGPLATGATSSLVAEGKLSVPSQSAGSNSGSNTSVIATFSTTGTTINLKFNAGALGEVDVGTLGDNAGIVTTAQFRIFDNTTHSYVDITDDLHGGTSNNVQPTALNISASTLDPASPVIINNPSQAYSFSAALGAGTYTISLLDSVQVTLSTAAAVPEPISMTLLGSGLVGLGLLRLKRNKA